MASASSTAALGRARAGRLLPNPPKSQQPPQSSRGLVVPSVGPLSSGAGLSGLGAPSPVLGNVVQASNVELFLANLRILDLDLLEDWPEITVQTFASSAAGQRRRVQAVEWALYHLFRLWDPHETRSKLEPIFPPTDQVQSLNLRAALLRSLEQVKKNGFLGRDAVIRKTMLDECRGDRLEEVLATFSFAVVRKIISDRTEDAGVHPAVAQSLALENRGYSGERTELAVLKLAHQAVLSKSLREKNQARKVYGDFAELLSLKGRSITRRREQAKVMAERGGVKGVSEDEKLDVWRLVKNNWAGNERWMETLLYGDSNTRRDGLLSTPFDKVWRRVQAGRLSELDDRGSGLMEQLDSRVRVQQDRLRKWEGFRKSMLGDFQPPKAAAVADQTQSKKGLGLRFPDHQNLHLGRMSPRKEKEPSVVDLTPEYADLIASFERDLKELSQPKTMSLTALLPRPAPSKDRLSVGSHDVSTDAISELEDLEEEVPPPVEAPPPAVVTRLPQRKPSHRLTRSRKLAVEDIPRPDPVAEDERRPRALKDPPRPEPAPEDDRQPHVFKMTRPAPRAPLPERSVSPPDSPTPAPRPHPRGPSPIRNMLPDKSTRPNYPEPKTEPHSPSPSPPLPSDPPISLTQQQADDILSSISAASPSPTKPKPRHTLSLAERTRLSMSRGPRLNLSDDEDIPPLHRKPKLAPEPIEEDDKEPDNEDLVARTRRSMAGFDAARQKAQLERRRSARKSRREGSHFPRGADGGGHFAKVSEEDHEASVLAEELMEGQHNYEDVFMSRPKIKASPVPSPSKEFDQY
ncbi:uncharacterized protein DNG_01662 [Cephalotrichum gorgonifer]|uniref:HAUS augmin-like complex subunit 6 N-terminal domain-containing protein n=1 Tax=Cephalotrichum gorgonifer TaxID=2041049 RepID=A0AAE8SSH6_9PEZI|nr:uncharacterized protein DNG_01662 [Cephalotrichum gorgonifer]